MTYDERVEAVAQAAEAWRDPDHEPRERVVRVMLEAPNRFTEEGLAFALNHLMHSLAPDALRVWRPESGPDRAIKVGVMSEASDPLGGLRETLAVMLSGHRPVVRLNPASPALGPAFVAALGPELERFVTFADESGMLGQSTALVASGDADEVERLRERAQKAGIPEGRVFAKPHRLVIAVIDGGEDAGERSGLAEDLLVHEGISPRSPAIVWAPEGTAPDALLDALAGFREVYPPHPDTDGTLALPTAFLASTGQPHATGPGFLLSRGDAEPQAAGHIRWTEYGSLAEVNEWLRARRDDLDFVVARPAVAEQIDTDVRVASLGDAHRPALGDAVPGLAAFLANLG